MDGFISGFDTDVLYLDYSRAFDRVDHEILLTKLKIYRISDKCIKWIDNFLSNRYQVVKVNGSKSYSSLVKSGVPQGTVIGPLLFVIFINDIPSPSSGSTVETFADDTKISRKIESYHDMASLQNDLEKIVSWSLGNNMKLNDKKFQLIIHRGSPPSQLLQSLPFDLQGSMYTMRDKTDLEAT